MDDLKGLNALLVEPHQGMRTSLHNLLNQCGLTRIDDVPNATQAIRQLAIKHYDLVLCEYELEGGQDGQQMLEDLRQQHLVPADTMFFMVTGEGHFDKVVSAAELAPCDYILKPFTADNLLERIGRARDRRALFLPLYQLIEAGGQREAIAAAQAGAAAHPRHAVDFLRLCAEQHLFLGEPAEAEQIYQALYASKSIAWARLGQAKALFLRQRYGEAQAMLEELLSHHRNFIEAYDWLARAHEAASQLAQAQAVLTDAVELSPHAVRRLRRLGEVALETGDVDTAERSFKQVINKARYSEFRDPEDHAKLVQAVLRKGDAGQAAGVIRDLDKALAGKGKAAACSAIASAMLHEYAGDEARLAQSLDNALAACRSAPGLSGELKIELARNCLLHGREEQAAGVIREVLGNAASNAAMGRAMALLERAGHGELATRLAQESRQQVVELVAAGAALAGQGDYAGAVALMQEAVRQLPDNPQVLFNAAVAVLKCLDHGAWDERLGQEAARLIDGVRRLDPLNAKLKALAELHQQILKKHNIATLRRVDTSKAAAPPA